MQRALQLAKEGKSTECAKILDEWLDLEENTLPYFVLAYLALVAAWALDGDSMLYDEIERTRLVRGFA